MSQKKEIARFLAKSKSGKKYMLIEYKEESLTTSPSPGKQEERTVGQRSFTTVTGLAVEYINPKTFKIVETGEYIEKI